MEIIYRWFTNLFGSDLAEHLSGWDDTAGDYTKSNLFSIIGIVALIIAIVLCVAYYYIYNHPRFNRWWSWLIVLLTVVVVNFGIGFAKMLTDLHNDKISPDIAPNISNFDCLGFGLANLIVSASFFIICSFIIKWGSRNCKHSPFL
jgi:drug/metabolite transporter (DMT)-like permease